MTPRLYAAWAVACLLAALTPNVVLAAPSDTTADRVFGQPDFASSGAALTANGMNVPLGVAIDAAGRLYVADQSYNRVLIFDNPATGDTTADTVLGQPDFVSGGAATTRNGLSFPSGVAFDSSGRVYVSEFNNNRVLIFDNPATNDTTPDTVLGQPDFVTATAGLSRNGMDGPSGVQIDAFGRLYVSEFDNNRVLVFDNPANDTTADTVLGQVSFTASDSVTSDTGMSTPDGIALDGAGRLYVADRGNNRILIFDRPTSDSTADTVIGQPGFTTSAGATSATTLRVPRGVALDSDSRLYVADRNNHRVLIFDKPVNDTTADTALGQPDFVSSTTNEASTGLNSPAGVALDTSGRLYVAERTNRRVIIFNAVPSRVTQTTRANNHQRGQIQSATALPFEVTGKGADGIAVAGRTPVWSVSFAPSGATGYSLDTMGIATTSSSGTAGVRLTLGNKNGVYQVTVTLDDTSAVFTAYSDSIEVAATTWTMFGPNKSPTTPTRAGVIEDDGFGTLDTASTTLTSGYVVYRSDPTATFDSSYGIYVVPTTIDTGRSYWLYSATARTLDVDGVVLADTFSVRIYPGWNMVSNPFPYFIDFDSDVQFQVDGGAAKSPPQAQSDSISDGVIFWYDNSNSTFRWGPRPSPVSSGSATASSLQLKPFVGYVIYAHQACTMIFYPNPRDPASSTVLNQAPKYKSFFAAGESTDWEIQLALSGTDGSLPVSDIENYVGVRSSGTLTVRDAPTPPSGGVSLSVAPYGGSGAYALHYAASLSGAIWEISSYSSSGGNATITASGVAGVPSDASLLLRDESTGHVTNLRALSTYSYASSAGETRRLTLSASASGLPASGAKVLFPSACVISRTIGDAPSLLSGMRALRDGLLDMPFGRVLVGAYYNMERRPR